GALRQKCGPGQLLDADAVDPRRFAVPLADIIRAGRNGIMTRFAIAFAAAFALAGMANAQAPATQRPDPRNVRLRGDRFKPLTYDDMTAVQKTMLEHLFAGPRGGANGPFNVL